MTKKEMVANPTICPWCESTSEKQEVVPNRETPWIKYVYRCKRCHSIATAESEKEIHWTRPEVYGGGVITCIKA